MKQTMSLSLILIIITGTVLAQDGAPSGSWRQKTGFNTSNYFQIVSETDTFFKYHSDENEENSPSAEYSRWKSFWGHRVNAKNGSAGSFGYVREAMVDWMLHREEYCQNSGIFNSDWKCIGPFHTFEGANEVQGLGLITSVYVFPGQTHILAGSNSGGLWETTNSGSTWTCITDDFTNGLPTMGVEAIGVGNSGTNIVIATGTNKIGRNTYGLGVCYSTNSGQSWNYSQDFLDKLHNLGIDMPFVGKIKFKPSSNSIVYATCKRYVFKSTDGGVNWGTGPIYTSPNTNAELSDLEFLPSNSSIFFVTGSDGNGVGGGIEIIKFTNDGANWSLLPSFPLGPEFITNGAFTSNMTSWNNSGTGNSWTYSSGNANTQNFPLTSGTPQYMYQTLASGRLFIEGCKFSFNASISVPANCTLKVKVIMQCDGCPAVPTPGSAQPSYSVASIVGPYTGTLQNIIGSSWSIPVTANNFYVDYYPWLVFEASANSNYNSVSPITVDNVTLRSSSQDINNIGITNNDGVYIMYHETQGDPHLVEYDEINNNYPYTTTSSANFWYFHGTFEVSPALVTAQGRPYFYCEATSHQVGRSTDGGVNFPTIPGTSSAVTHADVREIVPININSTTDVLYVGNDGGCSKYDGSLWYNLNGTGDQTLAVTQFYAFGLTEFDPDNSVGGAQDNGANLYTGDPLHWDHTWTNDNYECAFNVSDPNIVISERQPGGVPTTLIKSLTGGISWNGLLGSVTSANTSYFKPLQYRFDPVSQITTLFAGFNDLELSTNDGTAWTPGGFGLVNLFDPKAPIYAFEVNETDPGWVYVCYDGTGTTKKLFVKKGSQGFFDKTSALNTIQSNNMSDVISNPNPNDPINNPKKAWISFSGFEYPIPTAQSRVFKTIDGGDTWTSMSNGLPDFPVNCLVYYKGSDDIIFAGTDIGVYVWNKSANNGAGSWECFSTNLPATIITDLEINYCSGKLRASTYGRAMWETYLPPTHTLATTYGYQPSNGETWNSDRRILTDVVIPSGVTLTINNSATIFMAANTYIKIQPGGKLIIDNATLTNNCDGLWSGVQVVGNSSAPSQTAATQGTLVMKNNARIENAYVGAMADEAVYTTSDFAYPNGVGWKGGGIIQVDNSSFSNCRNGIGFASYHAQLINNIEPINKSYIKRSVFENTGFLNYPDNTLYTNAFISMYSVHRITMQGNKFFGPATINPSISAVNGIISVDADYLVTDWCNPNQVNCIPIHTEFHDMYRGVESNIIDPAIGAKLFMVTDGIFTNVTRGIYLSGHTYASAVFNTMSLTEPNDVTYGIYTNACTFYSIEENSISGLNPYQVNSYGIIINNSVSDLNQNDDNVVYKNVLKNLKYGTTSMNRNANTGTGSGPFHGLEFRCNTYDNNGYGIAVFAGLPQSPKITIKKVQGSTSDPVGNQFLNIASPEYSLWKATSIPPIDYYHHSSTGYVPPTLIQNFVTHNTLIAADQFTCPSHFSDDGSLKIAEYSPADAKELIESFEESANNLFSVIDGGNTAELIEKANNQSITSGELKTDLLTVGPYLSDSVLNASLSRTIALNNSDAKAVILNNSPVTDSVYTVLEVENPSVANNVVIQNAQDGVSERTNLEGEIGSINLQRFYALRDLRDYYEENDSVQSSYDYFGSKEMDMFAIPSGMMLSDWEGVQQIINDIPQGDLKDYMQMSLEKHIVGARFDSLTGDELSFVTLIANEISYSGILASNLLAFLNDTWYDEEIPIAEQSDEKQLMTLVNKTDQIPGIYPNPATYEFYFLIPQGYEDTYIELFIYDIFGKEILTIPAQGYSLEIPVSVKGLNQGVYYCKFFSNNEVVSIEKLVILR